MTETATDAPPQLEGLTIHVTERGPSRKGIRQTILEPVPLERGRGVIGEPLEGRNRAVGHERGDAGPMVPTGGAVPMQGCVSLRPLKAVAETFGAAHPLRTLLMGEPDEVPATEYAAKVAGWFRLMRAHPP